MDDKTCWWDDGRIRSLDEMDGIIQDWMLTLVL